MALFMEETFNIINNQKTKDYEKDEDFRNITHVVRLYGKCECTVSDERTLMGEGSSIGTIYDAARTQAMTVAQGEIARKMKTDMTTQIEQDLANDQLGQQEAESIAQTVVTAMGKSVDQTIGRPSSLVEMYRDLPNGNVEVLVRLAVSSAKLDNLAKQGIEKARKEYLAKRVGEVKEKME